VAAASDRQIVVLGFLDRMWTAVDGAARRDWATSA